MQRLFLIVFLCLLWSCASEGQSQSGQNQAQQTLKADKEEGPEKDYAISEADKQQAASNYLVPSPGEILSALNKLDRVDWTQLASFNQKANYENKYARSLNLGVRVADAFVAINAEDSESFGEMSSIIFDLGQKLGIGRVLTEKRADLDELAGRGAWSDMRAELDNVQSEIQSEVEALGESDLVVLASLGGWLEGLRVVSGHLKDNYSEDNSELLNQGGLIGYYAGELDALGSDATTNPLVGAVKDGLLSIQTALPEGEAAKVSQESVQKVNDVSSQLVTLIEQG